MPALLPHVDGPLASAVADGTSCNKAILMTEYRSELDTAEIQQQIRLGWKRRA